MSWQADWSKTIQATVRPQQLAVVEACIIGLLSGLAAVFLKQSVGFWGGLRLSTANQYPAWIVLPLIGAIGGAIAGLIIDRIAPEAAGSGIPQVKIAVAGLPTRLNLRLAIAKLLSTLAILSSGFPLGRQGPTVQIGAAIAAQFSRWLPTSPEHRRQLIAAGAAAGLAAGFNAPIAGVLFVIEELLQDVSGLTLGTAILASFIGAVVSRGLGGATIVTPSMTGIHADFALTNIPLFLLLGALMGGLGVIFIRGVVFSYRWQQRWMPRQFVHKLAIVGGGAGIGAALLPAALRDSAGLQEVSNTGSLSLPLLALLFAVKLGLTLIAAGSGGPGGIFAPSLVLGSTFGYLFAHGVTFVEQIMPFNLGAAAGANFTSTCALIGMASLFSAVTRGPITAIVIVFEMTGDFNLILPLMIGSVTAYWVGESIQSGSIYKYMLAANGIKLQAIAPPDSKLANLKAADLMQRNVESLPIDTTIEQAKAIFNRSHHRGFPVMLGGELVGLLTQSDLTRNPLLDDATTLISEIMSAKPVTVRPHDPLGQVLYLLNRYKISRLPVIDRQKLVGIITRADIIRAEAEQLTGDQFADTPPIEPSYLVYQTREPAIGVGRLLVPVANPITAEPLLRMAATIAQAQHYELECIQIIQIPSHQSPAETPVSMFASRALTDRATTIGQVYGISVHTQIRVAHSIADSILEIIQERHIDLLLMGWSGGTSAPEFVFGSVVDTLVQQANCRMLLVKLAPTAVRFERWLVPTAGGPNSRQALRLLPALLGLSVSPEIYLCHVARSAEAAPDGDAALKPAIVQLKKRVDAPIKAIAIRSPTIAAAIVDLAAQHDCDVIVVGATRSGMLQQVMQGNIPEEIARRCDCTVILVREAVEGSH
jgi:chloride channel protein, CIC family